MGARLRTHSSPAASFAGATKLGTRRCDQDDAYVDGIASEGDLSIPWLRLRVLVELLPLTKYWPMYNITGFGQDWTTWTAWTGSRIIEVI